MAISAGLKVKNVYWDELLAYFRVSVACIKRSNPVKSVYKSWIGAIKGVLTVNKKLKIAKYRVAHLRYRMNQMEKLIQANNPSSYISGKSLNTFR